MYDLRPLDGMPAGVNEEAALQLLEGIGDGRPVMKAETFAMLRIAIGNQDDVARDMGVNRRTLGRYERGEREISLVPALQIRRAYRQAMQRKADTLEAVRQIEASNA